MTIPFTTSPDEDALLQKLSDDAMIGRGQEKQPSLNMFTDTYLHAYLDTGLKALVQAKRDAVKAKIEAADPSTLDAVKAAVEQATTPAKS